MEGESMRKIYVFVDEDVTVEVPAKYDGKEVEIEWLEPESVSGMNRVVINFWVYYVNDTGEKVPVPDFKKEPMILTVGYKDGEEQSHLKYWDKGQGKSFTFTEKDHKYKKVEKEHTKKKKKYQGYGIVKIKTKWDDPTVGWGPGGRG